MKTILLSETRRHRALILDMYYQLVRLLSSVFQLCPWDQKCPPPPPGGRMFYIGLKRLVGWLLALRPKGNHAKLFLSDTTKHRAVIFGM